MSKFDLSLFNIEQLIMQMNYPHSFFLWDNSGKIWEKIKSKFPNLKIKQPPEPNNTTFSVDRHNSFSVSIDKFNIVSLYPDSNFDDFIQKCVFFYKVCLEELSLNVIERLALRVIYSKEFSSLDDINKSFNDLALINFPQKKLFNIAGKFNYSDLRFKWEGETLGCSIRLRNEKRNLDFDPPLGWEITDVKKEKYLFTYDVDYYTIGNVKVSQIDIPTWLTQANRQIKIESETFFKVK